MLTSHAKIRWPQQRGADREWKRQTAMREKLLMAIHVAYNVASTITSRTTLNRTR